MAIVCNATDEYLFRNAAPPAGNLSFSCWFWMDSVVGGAGNIIWFGNSSDTGGQIKLIVSGTNTLQLWANSLVQHTVESTTTISTSTWYHVACVGNTGTAQAWTMYVDGAAENAGTGGNGTSGGDAYVAGLTQIFNSPSGQNLNGRITSFKTWSAQLTAAEVAQEMRFLRRLRSADLYTFHPLLMVTDTTDYSGAGRSLTVQNALATTDGPPVAWGPGRRTLAVIAAVTTPRKQMYYQRLRAA